MTSSIPPCKRILIVTGHYGSGKTEFAVSLAMLMAGEKNRAYKRLAMIDLDIVNPYFRTRERREMLEDAGISVYGSVYRGEITAELPALGADTRAPLEDRDCQVIVDVGGNDSGALVLNQFRKYFTPEETTVLLVVNACRFETRDADSVLAHMGAIETATGLSVDALVNNTHLLRETTADTIARGHALCMEVAEKTGKPLWCDTYPAPVVPAEALYGLGGAVIPLGLYMRPAWLDR